MKRNKISLAINGIDSQFVKEAEKYSVTSVSNKKSIVFRVSVVAAVILCMASGLVVLAGNHYSNWSSLMKFDDGTSVEVYENIPFKAIPKDAPVVNSDKNDNPIEMTRTELEKALGFTILNSVNVTSDNFVYNTFLNKNGSIASVMLFWPDFIQVNDSKQIFATISILNENAEEGYILPFKEGIDATGNKEFSKKYELENLNISAVVYLSDFDGRLNATFVYDNIYYHFTAIGYTESEFISILQTLK